MEYWSSIGFWSRAQQTKYHYIRPILLRVRKNKIKSKLEYPRPDEIWVDKIEAKDLEIWDGSSWKKMK